MRGSPAGLAYRQAGARPILPPPHEIGEGVGGRGVNEIIISKKYLKNNLQNSFVSEIEEILSENCERRGEIILHYIDES